MDTTSRKALISVFLTVFIDLLGFGIVLPLLPRYSEYYQADGFTIGLLMSSFSAMQFLFAPWWGRLSDRIGRRPVLLVGLFGSACSYLAFGLISQKQPHELILGLTPLTWLFITRIGAGIAGATIPTAQAYIADSTTAEGRGKGMAIIGMAFGMGFTFGPLIGAAFARTSLEGAPSAAPGLVAGALSFLAWCYAFSSLPESLKPGSTGSSRSHFDTTSLKLALGRKSIALLLASIFVTTLAFAQFESTLSQLTKSLGVADQGNFFVFAYIGFILTLAQGLLVRRFLPKIGEWRMAAGGILLMSVGLLLIALCANQNSISLLYAILPVTVVGYAATTPSLQSLVSLNTSASDQGGVLGIGQSVSALARIAGPVIGMTLFDKLGHQTPYFAAASIMAASLLLLLAIPRKPTSPLPTSAAEASAIEEA